MNKKILCKTCIFWVDCTKDNKPKGFCLLEDLFTYTDKEVCENYTEGKPVTEAEYEDYNFGLY